MDGAHRLRQILLRSLRTLPMPLIPRWRFMTDEAKALARRTAVSAAVVLLVLVVFRSFLGWAVLALLAWWIWTVLKR